jgi:hypothetical protein
MRLNTTGTSINTSLYVSGTTIINNAISCLSSLNIGGNVGIGTTNILSRLTIRGRYDDGNSGGLCINSFI